MPVRPDPFGSFLSGRLQAADEFRTQRQFESQQLNDALNRAIQTATAPLQIATLQERLEAVRQQNKLDAQFGAAQRQADIDRSTAATRSSSASAAESEARLADFNLGADTRRTVERNERITSDFNTAQLQAREARDAAESRALISQRRATGSASSIKAANDAARLQNLFTPLTPSKSALVLALGDELIAEPTVLTSGDGGSARDTREQDRINRQVNDVIARFTTSQETRVVSEAPRSAIGRSILGSQPVTQTTAAPLTPEVFAASIRSIPGITPAEANAIIEREIGLSQSRSLSRQNISGRTRGNL